METSRTDSNLNQIGGNVIVEFYNNDLNLDDEMDWKDTEVGKPPDEPFFGAKYGCDYNWDDDWKDTEVGKPPDEAFFSAEYGWDSIPMSTPILTSLTPQSDDFAPEDMSAPITHHITHSSTQSTESEVEFDPDMFLNPIYKMDKEEEVSYMETNMFSPDSGYGSSSCVSPGSPNTELTAAEATNLTLKKRPRAISSDDDCSIIKKRVSGNSKLPGQDVTTLSGITESNPAGYTNCEKTPTESAGYTNYEKTPTESAGYTNYEKTPTESAGYTNYEKTPTESAGDSVTLRKDDFQEKLCDFRAGSHCSLDVSVVIVTRSKAKKSLKDIKLSEVTLEFLNTHFNTDCHVILKKRHLNSNIVDQFKLGNVTIKRSVVSCQHVLKGVALHLIDLKLQSEGGDRKKANNKFSHYARSNRSAGDKLTNDYAEKFGLNAEDYKYIDIEKKMQVSLMIFDKMGYLVYCSKELKPINCVLYDNDEGMFLVKARFVKAFGSYYNNKGKNN